MKAYLCREFGPISSHQIETIEVPTPTDNDVLIEVYAAGVAFPDVLVVQGLYQIKPEFPFSPGGEFTGVIKGIGKNVKGWKEGDRVIGFKGSGGFAEYALCNQFNVMPLPDSMDYLTGSIFPLNYGTSIHAFKQRAELKSGEDVLIMGAAGGLGISAIHVAKAMGARVIAAASESKKLELCKEAGADETILYSKDLSSSEDQKIFSSQIKELTNGNGVDVTFDPVGGDYSEPALRAMAWKGRYLVIGFTSGIAKIPLNLALLKGCQIVGVFWGSFCIREAMVNAQNFSELFEMHANKKIQPKVEQIYSLDQATDAIESLANRKARGKVAIQIKSE